MAADVSLVEASEIDSERLAEIAKRAYDSDVEYGAPAPGGPQGYDSPAFYTRSLKYLGCYAVLLGEEVVGGAMVSAGGTHVTIERLFVDPDRHREGVGSAAVGLLAERYPEATLWTLGAPEWNTRAPPFLESLGFKQIGWEHTDPKVRARWFEKRIGDVEAIAPIGTLKDGMSNVTVEGKVTEKSYPRSVRSKRGGELMVANAGLEDATGRIVMVLWDKQFEVVKVGARLRVERGYTNAYGGVKQLNVGYGRLIILM
ncbi:TPA: GNAT family N-acetyltransferase [Candidatus Bathyarchaeota archaeon]|nr:GNAT family N-acetyltransferase [Candidatus Bathyarchaeota archaeon]